MDTEELIDGEWITMTLQAKNKTKDSGKKADKVVVATVTKAPPELMTIIYRVVVVEKFEQFEATVLDSQNKIKFQKTLWSKFTIERWAQRVAGPKYKEIHLWQSHQKLKNQAVLWLPNAKQPASVEPLKIKVI